MIKNVDSHVEVVFVLQLLYVASMDKKTYTRSLTSVTSELDLATLQDNLKHSISVQTA